MTAFPFSAVVGMDELRLALLLNAVSPRIGGVLVRGEKGTAKSTTVRALATLLPPVTMIEDCRFGCDPALPDPHCPDGPHRPGETGIRRAVTHVELPVGATEDRLVGSLDIERALAEGVRAYEPGLFAKAHRGLLYVDEVNLLHDHLVDLLLDVAASGVSHVEREGVSVSHPSRFMLVGTMNPEEGELRPQLLDRFGLTVEVAAPRDPEVRAEVVRRRLAYETNPDGFAARWVGDERALAARIGRARALLDDVVLPERMLRRIAEVNARLDVDGLRGDLVTAKTAIAHAAWQGRVEVTDEDVRVAARLALPHRSRRNPFDAPTLDDEALDEALAKAAEAADAEPDDGDGPPDTGPDDGDAAPPDGPSGPPSDGPSGQRPTGGLEPGDGRDGEPGDASGDADEDRRMPGQRGGERPAGGAGQPYRTRLLEVPGLGEGAAGRRSRARAGYGRVTGARPPRGDLGGRPHLAATLLAAAPYQRARGRTAPGGLRLRREDLRIARHEGRESNLVLFVVDASGSMAARRRMTEVKGAVLSLLLDAYQRRDKVGLITFRGGAARLALPATSSVDAAARRLASLPTGGMTPLAAALRRAAETLRQERLRDPRRRPLLVLLTDGRATGPRGTDPAGDARRAAAALARAGVASVVVDCETGPVRLGLAAEFGAALGALPLRLDELAAGSLAASVRTLTGMGDRRR